MHMLERLTELAPGKGGRTAGFFHGRPGRAIRVHGGGHDGLLRRGLRAFTMSALLTGAAMTGWAGDARASAPAEIPVAGLPQSSTFNEKAEKAIRDHLVPRVATDLDVSAGFENGENLIRSAAQDKQFLLFGDTHHGHAELRQFMALPGTVDAMAGAGVKKIVLEMPEGLQPVADSFAAGTLTRGDFIDTMKNHMHVLLKDRVEGLEERVFDSLADMIEHASARDISVHFVNVMEMPESINDIAASAEEAWLEHVENTDTDRDDLAAMVAFMTDYLNNGDREALEDLANDVVRMRLDDKRRAEAISNVAGADKTAVFYGAGHFSNISTDDIPRQRDLDEYLGADKSVVINLHRDANALAGYKAAGHEGPDAPDHIYLLDGDVVMDGGGANAPERHARFTPGPRRR